MFRLDENTFILPDDAPARAVYTYQSQNWPANIYKNRVEGGGDDRSYAFAFSFENSNLVNYCNTVVDPMDHFLVFNNGSIFERQGDCSPAANRPAGNVFDASCSNNPANGDLHFYIGDHSLPYTIDYCEYDQATQPINPQCIFEGLNSTLNIENTSGEPECPSNIPPLWRKRPLVPIIL